MCMEELTPYLFVENVQAREVFRRHPAPLEGRLALDGRGIMDYAPLLGRIGISRCAFFGIHILFF